VTSESDDNEDDGRRREPEVEEAFDRLVSEGSNRLDRPLGHHYATLGVSWRSLLLAVLAGIVITLLTRMQHASDDLGPKLVAGVAMSFVLVAAQLFHSVLDSILMFTGLLGGQAAYTWSDWAQALGWSGFGNLIGGIGLVTSLRLLQAPHRVAEERADQS
jgi:formate-nitrite transporter family protein